MYLLVYYPEWQSDELESTKRNIECSFLANPEAIGDIFFLMNGNAWNRRARLVLSLIFRTENRNYGVCGMLMQPESNRACMDAPGKIFALI